MGYLKDVPWVVYTGVLLIGVSIWARDIRGSYVGAILIVIGFAQIQPAASRPPGTPKGRATDIKS